VKEVEFNAAPEVDTSDHKPVFAIFDLQYVKLPAGEARA
jgi:hypothetical protein